MGIWVFGWYEISAEAHAGCSVGVLAELEHTKALLGAHPLEFPI